MSGKSSLFNRLIEQDRAIVTDIPGTTRDSVSETASLGGIPVRFVDTAGIRAGQELVETLGIERSYQAIADADLTLVVIDASVPLDGREDRHRARAAAWPACDGREQGGFAGKVVDQRAVHVSALTAKASRHCVDRESWRPSRRKAGSRRRRASSPACGTSNCCARALRHWAGRERPSEARSRTRCCCWISTARCARSMRSPGRPPRMIF